MKFISSSLRVKSVHAPADRITMSENLQNLMDMTRQEMRHFMISLGEKSFHGDQVMKWIYHRGADDFDFMTDINKRLRAELKEKACIKAPEISREQRSRDGTIKWAMKVGCQEIESVYIPEDDRSTLCISTQVGCPLNCGFCSTGKQGFNRNLTVSEIIGQVWRATKVLGFTNKTAERAITNVVMMGMGEPLLNFKNAVNAARILLDDCGFGLSKRRVTISTAGIVPALYDLTGEVDVALALSLHAPNDELRSRIMPINDKYPIDQVLAAVKNYLAHSKGNHGRITIEYVLLDQVNDQEKHARELAELLRTIPCKINLIPFNPHPDSEYRKPSMNRINRFSAVLTEEGYTVVIRKTRGDDIDAACGQLVGDVVNRLRSGAV